MSEWLVFFLIISTAAPVVYLSIPWVYCFVRGDESKFTKIVEASHALTAAGIIGTLVWVVTWVFG